MCHAAAVEQFIADVDEWKCKETKSGDGLFIGLSMQKDNDCRIVSSACPHPVLPDTNTAINHRDP